MCSCVGQTSTQCAALFQPIGIRRFVHNQRLAAQECAVVIGSEGRGVSAAFLQAAQRQLIIPMHPRCESLNAAIAAAIVMWQMRQ